jgi:hypothetical protein
MTKFQELLDTLKDLDLPPNNYAVFGSAPLVITGMIEDVDDLIDNHSFIYEGINFIYPKKVIKYKKLMKRKKDSNLWDF